MNIFDIHLEFDHDKFRDEINKAIVDKKVGYVCVVDGNVLSQTHLNSWYRKIVCGALVNTCDGVPEKLKLASPDIQRLLSVWVEALLVLSIRLPATANKSASVLTPAKGPASSAPVLATTYAFFAAVVPLAIVAAALEAL